MILKASVLARNESYLKRPDSWMAVLFSDHIGVLVTRILMTYFPSVTPTLVTFFSMVPRLIAVYFFAEGSYRLAGVAYLIGLVLDGVDGKLSRATKKGSLLGANLDFSFDVLTQGLLIGAIVQQEGMPSLVAGSLVGIVVACMVTKGQELNEFKRALSQRPGTLRSAAFAHPTLVDSQFVAFGLVPLLAPGYVLIGLYLMVAYHALAWLVKLRVLASRP